MALRTLALALGATVLGGALALPALSAQTTPVPVTTNVAAVSTFIVTVAPGVETDEVVADWKARGVPTQHVYQNVLHGFAAPMTPTTAALLERDERVAAVEADTPVTVTQGRTSSAVRAADVRTGAGVTAYMIDSGLRADRSSGSGRVQPGHDVLGGDTDDCSGSGTQAADAVGSVARDVALVPVKVSSCTDTTSAARVIAAVDWVTTHHVEGTPAVASLGFESGTSAALDAAVRRSAATGIVYTMPGADQSVTLLAPRTVASIVSASDEVEVAVVSSPGTTAEVAGAVALHLERDDDDELPDPDPVKEAVEEAVEEAVKEAPKATPKPTPKPTPTPSPEPMGSPETSVDTPRDVPTEGPQEEVPTPEEAPVPESAPAPTAPTETVPVPAPTPEPGTPESPDVPAGDVPGALQAPESLPAEIPVVPDAPTS